MNPKIHRIITEAVSREKIHFSNIRGIEDSYYVPASIPSVIASVASALAVQETYKHILDVINDQGRYASIKDIKEYIESKLSN